MYTLHLLSKDETFPIVDSDSSRGVARAYAPERLQNERPSPVYFYVDGG
jgi:hypothetical protein